MTVADPVRVFQALGDPTRAALVQALARTDSASERALSAPLPLTRQAVAKHLAVLRDVGLVSAARVGRETRYRLSTDRLRDAEAWLGTVGREWERQLRLVRDVAERAGG